jgi:hypothetical protein
MHIGRIIGCGTLAFGTAIGLLTPLAAHADPSTFGLQLAVGRADHHETTINKYDLGLVWDPHLTWWPIGDWNFAVVGEAHAVYWHVDGNSENSKIGEFGASPVLRFEKSSGLIRPYFEAGVGLRVITHPRITDTYTMSSGFQFADMVGVGASFGSHQQYQIGYRFQHLSNASIKRPNPGIDFQQVYVQYNFK